MIHCPKCEYDGIPDEARFCPNCGEKMPEAPKPSTLITVTQEVGSVKGGKVIGVKLGQVTGEVTVESTVNQIEAKIIQGDYVDRNVIINLVVNEPHALDEILKRLTTTLGVSKQSLQNLGDAQVPENVSKQIAEVVAAQKEAATKGIPTSPSVCFELGMLAAYRRDYDTALDYFHQATQTDPEYSDAFEAIAWLLQSRAMDDINNKRNYDAAMIKLTDARTAAMQTDPLDPQALAQRGYIAKTLAQIAEAQHHQADREKYYQEAAQMFEHVAKLDPENASAQNGLGNVLLMRSIHAGAIGDDGRIGLRQTVGSDCWRGVRKNCWDALFRHRFKISCFFQRVDFRGNGFLRRDAAAQREARERPLRLLRRDRVRILHQPHDALLHLLHALQALEGIEDFRIRQHAGEQRGFAEIEACRGFPKIIARRGFGAVNAIAPFHNVEIQFENARFGKIVFEAARENQLANFAQQRFAFMQKRIARQLHRQRARAAHVTAFFPVDPKRFFHRFIVDAVVLIKHVVFADDNGLLQIGRDAFERRPDAN